ncbi:hypothetical protein EPO05_04305 [Patescibacteria group bacterium]|nr:MAG: hypothetical protein EPO05_04305 [Patescibacteria group bacterium]
MITLQSDKELPLVPEDIKSKLAENKPFEFEQDVPDLQAIRSACEKYQHYSNFVLIANGGSRTSAWAFYYGLKEFGNGKKFRFVTSAEPRVIQDIRRKYLPSDTLVIVISKSGTNINNIEPLLMFLDYPVLAITGKQPNTLREIAERKNWDIIIHPEVGGRFSGMTTCGLVPACLMGLDIDAIYRGALEGRQKYSLQSLTENAALRLTQHFFELEQKGYASIFASIYSSSIVSFLPLMTQIIHETYGKNRKGQTIFGDYSPESQHHTNQRLFGGPTDVTAMFLHESMMENDTALMVPEDLKDILFRGYPLEKLAGLSGNDTLHYDLQGVRENCKRKNIPFVQITLDRLTEKGFGEMMVFWQYFAVYSALLRDSNPFDQPEVEAAKQISLELRMKR